MINIQQGNGKGMRLFITQDTLRQWFLSCDLKWLDCFISAMIYSEKERGVLRIKRELPPTGGQV